MKVTANQKTLAAAVAKARSGREQYEAVQDALGIPWEVVAAIHYRESSFSFTKHLHNGDPLDKLTTRVPAGRPVGWMELPAKDRTWFRSAIDALRTRVKAVKGEWTDETIADFCERFNGLGYRNKGLPSPYVWSGTDKYEKGKYVADGKFNPNVVDKQLGIMVIVHGLRVIEAPVIDESRVMLQPLRQLSKNFHSREFVCKCGKCDGGFVLPRLLKVLQKMRDEFGRPVQISSGFRCPEHNRRIGGAADSQHTQGTAVDMNCPGVPVSKMVRVAEQCGADGIGRYSNRIHVDVRGKKARW
jgi:lysozyme family protein